MAAGSQDSGHVPIGRAFALVGDHWVAERGASRDSDYLWDDPDESDGWTGTTQALRRSPSKDMNQNRQASSITSRRCSGPSSRPDIYTFAPTDAFPDALVLQCFTVAGEIDGDEPVMRVAYVDDDDAQFTAEGDEIPEGEPALAEVLVHTAKVTQLVRLSNEQYNQTSTASQLAQSVSRAVTRRANLAFMAEAAPTPPAVAPVAGLVNVANVVEGDDVSGHSTR